VRLRESTRAREHEKAERGKGGGVLRKREGGGVRGERDEDKKRDRDRDSDRHRHRDRHRETVHACARACEPV